LAAWLIVPAAGASPPQAPAASDRRPSRELHPRAAELQALSTKLFPQRTKPSRTTEGVRALRAELRSLAAALRSIETDASPSRLESVRRCEGAARDAFESLRGQLDRRGRGAIRGDLDAKFQPLWDDVRQVLGDPAERQARIAAALSRIDAALSGRDAPRGLAITTLPMTPAE
jgi:hypothetical protein